MQPHNREKIYSTFESPSLIIFPGLNTSFRLCALFIHLPSKQKSRNLYSPYYQIFSCISYFSFHSPYFCFVIIYPCASINIFIVDRSTSFYILCNYSICYKPILHTRNKVIIIIIITSTLIVLAAFSYMLYRSQRCPKFRKCFILP